MCVYSQGKQNASKPSYCFAPIINFGKYSQVELEGKNVNHMYGAIRRRAQLKTIFCPPNSSSLINIHILFLHTYYVKACHFQSCPTKNLGNLLGIHFNTASHIQTNKIGRWELVSALLLQILWKKEAGQGRNLPKCSNSGED